MPPSLSTRRLTGQLDKARDGPGADPQPRIRTTVVETGDGEGRSYAIVRDDLVGDFELQRGDVGAGDAAVDEERGCRHE